MNPWLKLDDTNKRLYFYWDRVTFIRQCSTFERLPDFLRPFVEPIAEYVTDVV